MNTEKEKAITDAVALVLQKIAEEKSPIDELSRFLRHIESYKTVQVLSMTIPELELCVRVTNALQNAGLLTVQDVVNAEPKSVRAIKWIGIGGLNEIEDRFRALGIKLNLR